MKNNIKIVIAFILGIIVTSSVVYASGIMASSIGYKDGTVEDALNDLYNKSALGGMKICKLIDETYGTKGNVGAKYECILGDKDENDNYIKRNFYILDTSSRNTVDLIMERNITDYDNNKTVKWSDATNYFTSGIGTKYKDDWANVIDIKIPRAYVIARALGNNSFPENSPSYSNRFTFGTTTGVSEYDWIFNYVNNCTENGCNPETSLTNFADGYWTSDVPTDVQHNAFVVYKNGSMTTTGKEDSSTNGVRPVITIFKSCLYE